MKISVFAPARNEEGNIRLFIEKVHNAFTKNKLDGDIFVVNDGSSDKTGEILNELRKKYTNLNVVHNKKTLGITEDMNIAFNKLNGDIIIFLCSDLESNPEEDIPKLIKPIIEENYDMTVGWRSNKKTGIIKSFTSFVFNFLSSWIFKVKLHDMNWIKAFKKEAIKDVLPLRSNWHRYLAILITNKGYKIKEVKTNWYPRHYGKSNFGKSGLGRLYIGLLDLVLIKFYTSFSKNPMLLFALPGAMMMGLGFLIGLYLLHLWITGIELGRTLYLSILLIIMGTQLFALGFIMELISSLKQELKK
ncbi:MAG: glycosyltransferase family 2 protein [Candidatus Nanoarchaeia archaeon]|nr:glycosyltransferase family 2 protein [Candidatus Nanoarchaeia archaeon]